MARPLPAAYGATNPVFDTFSGTLPASGTLALNTSSNVTVAEVEYENQLPWPTNANGTGASLQLIDPHQDNWRVGNWAAVSTNAPVTPQWTYVTATGTASSSRFTFICNLRATFMWTTSNWSRAACRKRERMFCPTAILNPDFQDHGRFLPIWRVPS